MYSIYESLCKARGVTNYAVSKKTGISQAVLSAWKKRPDGNLSSDNMKILADFFDVSYDYMITGIDKSDEKYQDLVGAIARNEKRKEIAPYEPFIQTMVDILPLLKQEQIVEIIHYAEFCLYKNGLAKTQTQTDTDN